MSSRWRAGCGWWTRRPCGFAAEKGPGPSLSLTTGERRALIGPNGAGKTTLFNLIGGQLPVTTRTIRLDGRDVTHAAAHRRAALAAMTVLIIEHDMDIALGIADRITVLHYGRVIAEGSPEAVKGDPSVREVYLGA